MHNNNNNNLQDIFENINEKLINKRINENQFNKYLNILITNKFNLYNEKYKNYILYYKNNNYYNIYKFTLICYIKCKLENELNIYLIKIKKINKNYKELILINNIEEFIINKNIIINIIKYLYSFQNKYDELDFNNNINIVENLKNINKKLSINYENEKIEIINKLLLLSKRFNLKFLLEIGINIKSNIDIEKFNYKLLVKYYNFVVYKLLNFFINLENMIIEYVEILDLYNYMNSIDSILINVSKFEKILN